ncbi:MAG TPA: hypothetical protein PKH77_10690 [Anaerolineae bacterium]|nr:hypothetical protein [Anaerolineae bacterium]
MKHTWLFGVCSLVVLLLTACVTHTPNAETPLIQTSPLPLPQSPISKPATPAPPITKDIKTLDDLQSAVAQALGFEKSDLTLISSEEVQWRDSSLGCPQKDMHYLQVITPGWRVIFADATGKQYDIRTPENMGHYIICVNADNSNETQPVDKESFGSAKDAAVNALMEKLNVTREAISIVSVEAVEWRNSCLGCAGPDENCLMVITSGYRILLESGSETYTVHTNSTGSRTIVCEKPEADGTTKP